MRSYEIGLLISSNYTCRGKGPKSWNGPWAPSGTISNVRGEEMDAKGISNLTLVDKGAFGGRSKEGCLLERGEYGSNMHSVY